jgi:hypothetical protein
MRKYPPLCANVGRISIKALPLRSWHYAPFSSRSGRRRDRRAKDAAVLVLASSPAGRDREPVRARPVADRTAVQRYGVQGLFACVARRTRVLRMVDVAAA